MCNETLKESESVSASTCVEQICGSVIAEYINENESSDEVVSVTRKVDVHREAK